MVYFFTSRDGHMIYVGKNKFENEDLIKYGWPEDIWFHADDYSSAHIYLRLNEGETIDSIPQEALEDCCQLTREGSIEGSKQEAINIVYTPWKNLKKDGHMDVGQIGYHNEKERRLVKDVKKENVIVNFLKKTKKEEFPDLQKLQEQRILRDQKLKQEQFKQQQKQKQQEEVQKKQQQELKEYKDLFQPEQFKSNKEQQNEDDDFM